MTPGIYHKVIAEQAGTTEKQLKSSVISSPANDAFLAQEKMDWLQSSVTSHVFKQLSVQIEELESRARQLAVNYHNNGNHHEIIALLIRADTLRKFKETYGR